MQDPLAVEWVNPCQLAHGSIRKTFRVPKSCDRREIHQIVADLYSLPVSEILFCTMNTKELDMSKLLEGELMPEDVLYFHVKGKTKEATLTKSDELMGVTVTDNGTGYTFIKRMKENGIFAEHPSIKVGDHIEQIDKQSLVGMNHMEVSTFLKDIPSGSTFKLYLVEPKQEPSPQTSSHSKAQVPVPAGYQNTTNVAKVESLKELLATCRADISQRQSSNEGFCRGQFAVLLSVDVDLTGDKSCNSCQVNDITNPAVVYCKACREFYCSSCRDCHKAFKFTRDHVLVTLLPKHQNESDLKEEESISDGVNKLNLEENSSDIIND